MSSTNHMAGKSREKAAIICRWLSRLFLLAGVLALGYATYFYASAYAFQTIASVSLDRPRPPGAPTIEHVVAEGEVIGKIEIGRLGLSAIIAQGDSPSLLRRAVGHVQETAMPGESGNIALTAHRDTFFRPLRNIREGDVISVETPGGEYQYAVDSTAIVPPTAIDVLQSTGKQELTLITCYPFYYVGPAPSRFIVRARKIDHLHE